MGGAGGAPPLPIEKILGKILLTPLPKTKILLSKNDLPPLPKAENLEFTPLPKGPTSAHVCRVSSVWSLTVYKKGTYGQTPHVTFPSSDPSGHCSYPSHLSDL